MNVTTRSSDSARGPVTELHVEGDGRIDKLIVSVDGAAPAEEMIPLAPNANDLMVLHPMQVSHQASNHDGATLDERFGGQYVFTPPPLVHTFRIDGRWYGIGLGASAGKNQYTGWTYFPRQRDAFDLEIDYRGYFGEPGHAASIVWLKTPRDSAYEVIADYSDWLRESGFAPTPKRDVADWWREPFACIWGEQRNYALEAHIGQPGHYQTDTYETQQNQVHCMQRLIDKGIPFGVAATGDKWQLHRQRLVPDPGRYPDFRGFADWIHDGGRHVIAWYGMWIHDNAPPDWCIRKKDGTKLRLDPTSPAYARQLQDDVHQLISPDGYDYDGFFLDFSHNLPLAAGLELHGDLWGMELLHHYVKLIHDAAKDAKPDAMIMTHCTHPYFADVTDVFRLNDWCHKRPNLVEQMRYRHGIASNCSDWLINTDNWPVHSMAEWRRAMPVQPELGIPATWYTHGVRGERDSQVHPFTDEDYDRWREVWTAYMDSLPHR
ncbi:MAG: hypothetical protein AAGG38_01100 [Planctomycetota bacterium]